MEPLWRQMIPFDIVEIHLIHPPNTYPLYLHQQENDEHTWISVYDDMDKFLERWNNTEGVGLDDLLALVWLTAESKRWVEFWPRTLVRMGDPNNPEANSYQQGVINLYSHMEKITTAVRCPCRWHGLPMKEVVGMRKGDFDEAFHETVHCFYDTTASKHCKSNEMAIFKELIKNQIKSGQLLTLHDKTKVQSLQNLTVKTIQQSMGQPTFSSVKSLGLPKGLGVAVYGALKDHPKYSIDIAKADKK